MQIEIKDILWYSKLGNRLKKQTNQRSVFIVLCKLLLKEELYASFYITFESPVLV